MIIEITGTSTRNKGAELMLVSVLERLGGHSSVQFAVNPFFGSYFDRARYGLLQKVVIRRMGRSMVGYGLLPKSFRDAYGMVNDDDIDAIIDASGFAFGDQLEIGTACRFADDTSRWKSRGKPVILLPQAVGPFRNSESRKLFRRIIANVTFLCARDGESQAYAVEAAPEHKNRILLVPDITIAASVGDVRIPFTENTALVVPNARMLDQTEPVVANGYVPFLARCFAVCRDEGLNPVVLIHSDREDDRIVAKLECEIGSPVSVVRESDPVRMKRILGSARLVIGSRFHALVGALSSSVPVIAVGWSHKYERLLVDFGCREMLASVLSTEEELSELIRAGCGTNRDALVRGLGTAKDKMCQQIDAMWRRVEGELGLMDEDRSIGAV